jgi:hypothetical protein
MNSPLRKSVTRFRTVQCLLETDTSIALVPRNLVIYFARVGQCLLWNYKIDRAFRSEAVEQLCNTVSDLHTSSLGYRGC